MEASQIFSNRADRPAATGEGRGSGPRGGQECRETLEPPGSPLGAAARRGARPRLGGSDRRGWRAIVRERRGVASLLVATPSADVERLLHVQRSLHVVTSAHAEPPSLYVATPSLHVATPSADVETSPDVQRYLHLVTPSLHVATPLSTCGDLSRRGDLSRCGDPFLHIAIPSLHIARADYAAHYR